MLVNLNTSNLNTFLGRLLSALLLDVVCNNFTATLSSALIAGHLQIVPRSIRTSVYAFDK